MLTFTDIKPYLNTEKVDISKTAYLNSITQAVSDFVANYTNLIIDADSPKGLIQCVADMVAYHFSIRHDLEETVLFKCSASDCAALGILNIDDNFEFEDIQEQGKNTGEIEGVLNYKFIRYRNEWYKAVDIRKGNVFKGEPANVVITAEIVSDLLQAVNGNTFSGNTTLEIVVPVDKYKVYIDNILYNEYESGANVNLTPETKEGYRFKGYESYDVTIINNSFTMPENDVYINSIYAATFTVKIDNQILGEYEENEIVEIDAGSKEGFNFKNWSGNIIIDSPNSVQTSFNMPNFNVELQTEWEEVINTWTVIISDTMDMDGTYNVTKGDSITLSAGENTPQYDFSRWNIVSGTCEGDLTQTYTTITPTSDINIQCVWQFNNKWLVSYSGIEKAAEYILAGMTVYFS